MHVRITADNAAETKVGEFVDKISGPIHKYFEDKNYGSSVEGICVVLMCRKPELNFMQRITFQKEKLILYADLMIDYKEMVSINDDTLRAKIISQQILIDLPPIIKKYKFAAFDDKMFMTDIQKQLGELGLEVVGE